VRWSAGAAGLDAGPATLLALLAAILVTGGFHEDGLADVADGLGAHVGRERKLEILRDSRVGTYGALALVFAVAFPLTVLTPLSDGEVLRAALAAHVLGRWSTLPHSLLLTPARPDGKGTLLRATPAVTVAASAYSAAIVVACGGVGPGAVALAVAVIVTLAGAAVLRRKLGGATGDGFGAVNKLVELATYAALAAAWA